MLLITRSDCPSSDRLAPENGLHCPDRDDVSSNRLHDPVSCLRGIFAKNHYALFGIPL
jgi:hypothetical protein